MSAESGFWRIFPEHDSMMKLESSFLHPWGMQEIGFGHFGMQEGHHRPYAELNAKEDIAFHRPRDAKEKEKRAHGGEVTQMHREFWLDEHGKLNYRTSVGLDGKALEPVHQGVLTKAIEHHH